MFDVSVTGLDAIRKLRSDKARDAIQDAANAVGIAAESQARLLSPIDTGRLRASITHEVRGSDVAVGSNVFYAAWMELGTRPHMPPKGALALWAKRHGISEWLVRKSIAEKGTAPRKFLWGAIFPQFRQTVYNYIIKGVIDKYWREVQR